MEIKLRQIGRTYIGDMVMHISSEGIPLLSVCISDNPIKWMVPRITSWINQDTGQKIETFVEDILDSPDPCRPLNDIERGIYSNLASYYWH